MADSAAGRPAESWPPMAHVSAAAATGHRDYCPCPECEGRRFQYVRADEAATELSNSDRRDGLYDD